jgi:hypothetical protein
MDDAVKALTIQPMLYTNLLVAGGRFSTAGGVAAHYIARWNGSSWSALGSGMDGDVEAIAVYPNGTLVVAGEFTTVGGVPAHHIAFLGDWSAFGTGMDAAVNAVAVMPDGYHLVAGGDFTTAGGVPANSIASWDGCPGRQWDLVWVRRPDHRRESSPSRFCPMAISSRAVPLSLLAARPPTTSLDGTARLGLHWEAGRAAPHHRSSAPL